MTISHPLVCDYWIALGFTQKELSSKDCALNAFSTASFIDPNNTTSRYQLAEISLHLGNFDDALLALEDLREIIEKSKLDSLKPEFDLLWSKAQNKQSF